MKATAFLDLDGVLVDFVRGALEHHGRTDIPHCDVRWGMEEQLGIEPAKFWEGFGFDFWVNLHRTADGDGILAVVERIFGTDNVCLLTSPCATRGGVEGKVEWIRRNLPSYRRRFMVGPGKHFAAGPGKVLIDDHDNNVEAFRAHGGTAVLVPRPWNALKDKTDQNGLFDPGEFTLQILAAVNESEGVV